ncbi:Pantothenate transporter [Wickerhamomyces ciferrii]|uniref:Pantothenate transporter n=1 Tax=Wickerhamomyces ciferrii (strain ATCC 14091 / BCRC 22168 / CBS 111 / JCM 3599 / NBRC 0793 / NRRL Y-1031 F-60-10) TaxID=1206466 RepID=K0KS83_WICCF|nr:Pantothenate transporter [Wickerhamomyces ciferrii]CCH44857.1 Pantothenate transporter [Wickerhamomyces ciferrii]
MSTKDQIEIDTQSKGDTQSDTLTPDTRTKWQKFKETIWDGPKPEPEKRLVTKLDFFLLTWGCYGYFIRHLDQSNFTNAYVSGMKQALNMTGDDYNYALSIWQAGYVVGIIPSQVLMLKIQPNVWFPVIEIIWAVLTFGTASAKNLNQVYCIRFFLGLFESPFYIGALSLFANFYTEKELAKRACILYSASNISSMFSGYLQSAVYENLDGVSGRAGWQWLFIVCGSITLPLALWGLIAIPNTPYKPNCWSIWLNDENKTVAKGRFVKSRVQFHGFKLSEIKTMLLDWPFYVIVFTYTSYMIFTNATGYFTLYIQSLERYSISQINNIPTSAQGVALIGNIILGWLADYKGRHLVLQIALIFNAVSCVFLLITPSEGCVWFGYLISGVSWAYGPIFISWTQEFLRRSEFEAKFTLGIAQASAIANLIWATIVLWSTSSQYPFYRAAYIVSLILGVLQIPITYYVARFVKNQNRLLDVTEVNEQISAELKDEKEK